MSRIREGNSRRASAALLALTCLAAAACSGRAESQRAAPGTSPPPAPDAGRVEPPRLYHVIVKGKTGFIDATGTLVIPPQFDPLSFSSGREFSDGMARFAVKREPPDQSRFCLTERYGYIDATGKVAIPPQFDEAEQFSEGLAAVRVGPRQNCHRTSEDRYGYIDKAGRLALPGRFYVAGSFSEGLAGVCEEGWCGYIDSAGRRVFDAAPGTSPAGRFSGGLARVGNGKGDLGYIDNTGKVVIPPQFYSASDFSEGLALVTVGRKRGFIDRTGRLVIDPAYDVAYPFSDGLARVTLGGKNGYIDKTGKTVIEPQYPNAGDFSGGLAPVLLDRKWGYIDKSGRVAIKPQFDQADVFVGDLALVSVGWVDADVPQTGIKNGYIDKTGKYVWRPTN